MSKNSSSHLGQAIPGTPRLLGCLMIGSYELSSSLISTFKQFIPISSRHSSSSSNSCSFSSSSIGNFRPDLRTGGNSSFPVRKATELLLLFRSPVSLELFNTISLIFRFSKLKFFIASPRHFAASNKLFRTNPTLSVPLTTFALPDWRMLTRCLMACVLTSGRCTVGVASRVGVASKVHTRGLNSWSLEMISFKVVRILRGIPPPGPGGRDQPVTAHYAHPAATHALQRAQDGLRGLQTEEVEGRHVLGSSLGKTTIIM